MSEQDILRLMDTVGHEDKQLVYDAYFGSGGFSSGGYLVPYQRESDLNFLHRKHLAYFFNYTKPVINSAIDPVFREYPVRTAEKQDARWAGFLQDVDGKGTPLDRFMKKAALKAKLDGAVFIVVDNQAQPDTTLKAAVLNRQYPYLYLLQAADIIDYVLDKHGRLILFKYKTRYDTVAEDGNKKTIVESWTWTQQKWRIISDGVETEGINSIGRIPIVPLLGSDVHWQQDPLRPPSDFIQIAKINKAIYNACSELRQRNRSQAFSILTYGIPEEENPETFDEMITGTNNALIYKGNNPPNFITPEPGPSDMLHKEIDMMIAEIYRMAERSNVTGVQEQTSGIAKEWDNMARMQTLAEFAKNCETAEQTIAELFCLYLNTELGININYSDDFGVVDAVAELSKITGALTLSVGGKFDAEVKKQLARLVLQDQEDEVIDEVINDIDKRAEDNTYTEPKQ